MITYNVKIKTNDSDFLKQNLREIQSCYNFISDIIFENLKTKKSFSFKEIHHMVYFPARSNFPKLHSKIIIRLERQVYGNYKSCKSNKHEIETAIKSKTLSLRLDKDLMSRLTQKSIDLYSSTKNKRVTAQFVLYDKVIDMLEKYPVSAPTLFERKGELFLSLPFILPEPTIKDDTVLGIDRGIRRLVATSDGLIVKGTEFQFHKRKQNYLKRCLQSKGTKSARRHLKKVRCKQRTFAKNYCNLVANEILQTDKSVLVLENLKHIKQKTSKNSLDLKRTSHNRMFSQIPLFLLQNILTYKAQLVGKQVATVSPHNTSQMDCRGLKNGNRVGCRYNAVDGRQLDADINAGVNIANRYLKHPLSCYPNEIRLRGRLFVNQPIVAGVLTQPQAPTLARCN